MTAAKPNKGTSSRAGPKPQACSAAISLSWYMRPKVNTTASNRPTGTMTDRFMIAPSAIKSNTTWRPY